MHLLKIAIVTIVALSNMACASNQAHEGRSMATCLENATPANVAPESFAIALQKAQEYSDKVYGPDCFVCAQVFDDEETYMLHITSPIEDMLINTSAAITVRKKNGKVIERSIWHSCHARTKSAE